jgi:hypothetical protein
MSLELRGEARDEDTNLGNISIDMVSIAMTEDEATRKVSLDRKEKQSKN